MRETFDNKGFEAELLLKDVEEWRAFNKNRGFLHIIDLSALISILKKYYNMEIK